MLKKVCTSLAVILISMSLVSGSVFAQAEYPTKPITMYIGYKAGGGTDAMGRVLANIMSRELGQQVNVVNKAGAGGGVAAMAIQKMKPDGYSLYLAASDTLNWHCLLNKQLTYHIDDFDYAGMLTLYQQGLIAPKESPYNNIKEFLEYAKANPGIKYAFFNDGSKMIMQFIADLEGLKVNYVPAKGGSECAQLVLGNQVDLSYSGGIHQRYPGQMKLIAAATSVRQAANPDVLTLLECDIPLSTDTLTTLTLPKGTPQEIIAKLEDTLRVASTDPDLMNISKKLMYPISFKTGKEAYELLAKQLKEYEKLLKITGFEAK